MSMADEGRRVDAYLTVQPRQPTQSVLQSLKIAFEYLECESCGRILETAKLTDVNGWRFDLMGLRPSILGVAKATCPICSELQKQFAKVFRS